ncbi:MAG: hypothetical protein E4H27_04840, partial [Anaerolineales bacterium]
ATGDCDVCLTHSDYNLLTQSAARGVLEPASAAGVGVFNGSSLGMGLLSGENPQVVAEKMQQRRRQYQEMHKESRNLTQKIQHWLRRQHYARYRRQFEERISLAQKLWDWAQSKDIDLLALNIQYCMRDPRITATLMGAATPAQIEADVAAAQKEIPEWVWQELSGRGVTLSLPR